MRASHRDAPSQLENADDVVVGLVAWIDDQLIANRELVVRRDLQAVEDFGAELIAVINEKAFSYLQAPPTRVTGFDTPFPYTLEHDYLPDAGRIREAIQQVMNY